MNRRVVVSWMVLSLAVWIWPNRVGAAAVRGQLIRIAQNGARIPVAGVAVTVISPNIGRSTPSYTDGNGMYYLGIPAGYYTLEVWISRDPRVPPMTYSIAVAEPNTDIPPIALP